MSGKCSTIEFHITYQVGIYQSHRSSGSSLRTEMVDIWNLYSIKIESVFGWSTTTHNEVISISYRRKGHTGIVLYNPGNITVGSGSFLYFLQTYNSQADRTFCNPTERRCSYCNLGYGCTFLLHFYINVRGNMIHTIFLGKNCFIAYG